MGLFDIFSGSAGKQAAADQIAGINQGKDEATAAFGQGRDALTTDYAKGLQEWDPVTKTANQGESAYADAMGLNGPEGSARAQAAFRTDPSYQFKLSQGLAAANAQAAKNGTTASGGQLIDLNNYAQGTADQGWQNYIQGLSPFLGQATTAAGARSGIDTGLGDAINASYTNQGQLDYGADTSIGKAQAGGDMADYNASGNLWGAGLALAGDAAQAIGGGGVGKVKNLFGSFGAGTQGAPMAAKDYMVDVADIPKYGPPNMAAELYNMIRGVPKAYQEGKANEFANQKAEFEQDVERPYKKKALERADVIGDLQTKDALDYYNNPPQMPGNLHGADAGEPSPAQRLTQGTGGAKPGGQFSVADLTKGVSGISDQEGAVAGIERMLGIQPGARLTAKQEDAVRQMLKDAGGEEGESLTGSTGPAAAPPPDPRRTAPPNLQPGMMGGPPNLAPGSPQGPVPMMSGAAYGGPPGVPAGPPGAPPGTAVAQAGPPGLAAGLAPFVRPQQPAPAPGTEAPWNQGRIKQALTDADRLDDVAARPGMTAFPGRAAALKEKAKALREEAKQAQEALNKNLERTTEQKNALPGQTPQESAASAAAMKVQAEAQADNLKTRLAGYKPARDSIQVLDEMKDAFKAGGSHISTGPGAPNWLKVKQAVNNMAGTDIFKGVPESEQIDKLNAYLSAAVAKSMTARPTQYEFKAFQQQNPGLLTSPKGSENLMDILRQTKVQEAELARMASKFKVGGGQDWLDVEEKYFWEHPIISPLTKKPIDAQKAGDGKWYRLNPMTGKYAVE